MAWLLGILIQSSILVGLLNFRLFIILTENMMKQTLLEASDSF